VRCADWRVAALTLLALLPLAASAQADGPYPATARGVRLPSPPAAADWDTFKLQAAQRLVDAHPDSTYIGTPPEPLYGIPVLEVELNADGSVRRVRVVREPVEAKETIRLAIDAVHHAAPYGSMKRLPKPWKFVEVFLFDEQLRFKPATLDH
jgi:hypothetical protein